MYGGPLLMSEDLGYKSVEADHDVEGDYNLTT